ncbi:MAG: Hsp20 family protein [Bacteroidetes bacterium]|jgi:HSP20 family protein|nr:Hsp20 family protein [Bacteroidota bacterium]
MLRAPIQNRAFDRMGERWARLIDPYHFLGRSSFDVHLKEGRPPVNIIKNGKLFEMEIMVPGFKKGELDVSVDSGVLTIKGEKNVSHEDREGVFVLEEFDFSSFERKFKLADSIKREKISARYENGILRLTFVDVPEAEETDRQTVEVT